MAVEHTYASPQEAARKMHEDVRRLVFRAGGGGTDKAAQLYLEFARRMAPVGGIRSKPRKGKPPGRFKAGIKLVSAKAKETTVYGLTLGGPHKYVIDKGLHRNLKAFRVRRKGKLLKKKGAGGGYTVAAGRRRQGSPLARYGVRQPAWRMLLRAKEKVEQAAIRAADSAGGTP